MAYNRVGEFSFSIAPRRAAHCTRPQDRSAGHCDTGSHGLATCLIASQVHTNMSKPDPFGDDNRAPLMNLHHLPSYDNRTPSPGRPLDSYQLQDNPYGPSGHLPMPSSDRLVDQPTVSRIIARGCGRLLFF